MFAYVEALFDKQKFVVPIEFFEDSVDVERELKAGKQRDEYLGFWSPNDSDTPESVKQSEKRLLRVDDIHPAEIARMKKRGDGKFKKGIPGLYKMHLIQWEGTYYGGIQHSSFL